MVAYASISATTYATRTNTTVTAPSGITNGDLLIAGIAIFGSGGEAVDPTPPSGFNPISGPTWPVQAVEGGNEVESRLYTKTASGESGDYTFTHADASTQGWVVRVSDPGVISAITSNTGTGTTTTATGVTPSTNGALVLFIFHDWLDTGTDITAPSGTTPTFTERLDGATSIFYIATGNLATAGATGDKSTTNRNVGADPWAAYMIVVEPAATVEQEGFRFRNDDGDEDAATWRQSQDVADTAELDEQIRLRALLNGTGDPASTQYQLEYKQDSETWWRPIGVGYPGTLPAITSSTGTTDATAGTTVAANYPATVTAGDLLIFVVAKDDDATGITDTTGGLNVIRNGNTESGTDGVCLFAGWMIAAGTEDGTTRTFTGDSEEWQTWCIRILAGAFDASNPIDSAATLNGNTTGEAITDAFTCVRPGGLVIACGAVDIDPMDATFSPAGWTDVVDTDAGEVTAWVSTRDAATTLAETIASATFGINTSDASVSLAFVVNAPLGTPAVTYYASSNYADGDATTAQLTAPSGKTTGDFDAGVMVEGQALADAVNVTTDDYTEIEWAVKAQTPAVDTDVYEFRVTANGTLLSPYTVTPELTIASGGTTFEEDLAGSITGTGALVKSTAKAVAGSSTPTGALTRSVAKAITGSITGVGAVAKSTAKALAGSVTPTGAGSRSCAPSVRRCRAPSPGRVRWCGRRRRRRRARRRLRGRQRSPHRRSMRAPWSRTVRSRTVKPSLSSARSHPPGLPRSPPARLRVGAPHRQGRCHSRASSDSCSPARSHRRGRSPRSRRSCWPGRSPRRGRWLRCGPSSRR